MHKSRPREGLVSAALGAGQLAVALSASATRAEPVESPRYGKACLRIEARGMPWESPAAPAFHEAEQTRANAGCEARWIQVLDHHGVRWSRTPSA